MHQALYLPAEWHPQSAVILTWPHPKSDWADTLSHVEPIFAEIARHISYHQQLILLCYDADHQTHVKNYLNHSAADIGKIQFHNIPTNDTWARDYGPITRIHNQKPELLDFQFNAWGSRYESQLDNQVTPILFGQNTINTPLHSIPLVLEGGSIESDGAGTLLTTSQCLLSADRNPNETKDSLSKKLKELFGIKRILWLNNGHLAGDDTDSHIDNLARFTSENCIAYTSCDDPNDPHYAPLQLMAEELKQFKTIENENYTLVSLPIPKAILSQDNARLPASYANFLIINDAVLVPVFDDPNDEIALQRLQSCFPNRKLIGINCRDIIQQNGGIHCLTMQLPLGVL